MLLLIKMVVEYCQCTDDLPMLVTEVLGRLVDMMKVRVCVRVCILIATHWLCHLQFFNSRTCQLVLGAGAVEAVGLKTITARHLGQLVKSHPLSMAST